MESPSHPRSRTISLRAKLGVCFTVLGLVPALILGWVGYQRSAAELEKAAASRLQEAAVAYGETIDRSLLERYGDIADFVDSPSARDDISVRQELIDHLIEVHTDYDLIVIADPQGRIISVNTIDGTGAQLETRSLIGQSVADTDWFQIGVSGDLPRDTAYYSEAWRNQLVETAYGEPRLTLPFTGTILNEDGTIFGVWHSEVSFERTVADVMAEARHALVEQGFTTIETKVLRSDGLVLESADATTVGQLNLVDAGQEAARLATGPSGSSGSSVEENVISGVEQIAGYAVTDGAHGFEGYGWGILVRQDAAEAGAPAAGIRDLLFSIGLVIMGVTALIGVLMARSIVNPLKKNVELLEAVSAGDLTVTFNQTGTDEVGQMSAALSGALHSIGGTLGQVEKSTTDLTQSATQLTELSRDMSRTANRTSDQTTEVAAEAERIYDSTTTVAQAMEEMSSSISEISNNTSAAAQMTAKVVKVSGETQNRMEELETSAAEIGNVVSLITSIAAQTDLLALNATIEAHRVGEAGKGFAVVANEVKALAAQTSGATEQIQTSIEAIQRDASQAVDAIAEISDLVVQVNEISTTIAGAVEQQSATSAEVSSRIQSVTHGTANISESIGGVARATGDATRGADATLASADHLSELANELSRVLHRFTLPETATLAPTQISTPTFGSATNASASASNTGQPSAHQPPTSPSLARKPADAQPHQPSSITETPVQAAPSDLEEALMEAGWHQEV